MATYLPGADPTLAEETEDQRQQERIDAIVREVEKSGSKQEQHAGNLSSSTDMLASLGLEPVPAGKEVVRASVENNVSTSTAVERLPEGCKPASAALESIPQVEPADEAAIQGELDIFVQLYEEVGKM
jgi:hypothetical protein